MTTDELRGAPKPPNSVSLLFLTPHATALCYEGIILSNSQMRKLRHQEIKDLPVAEPARESTSSDTGARARSVPGAPEELPHGSLTIWQSEYCTERETEARGGGLVIRKSLSRLQCFWDRTPSRCVSSPPGPRPRRILKPSTLEPARPPQLPERSSYRPGQTQKPCAFTIPSQFSRGPVTAHAVTSQGGGREPSPASDGQAAPFLRGHLLSTY